MASAEGPLHQQSLLRFGILISAALLLPRPSDSFSAGTSPLSRPTEHHTAATTHPRSDGKNNDDGNSRCWGLLQRACVLGAAERRRGGAYGSALYMSGVDVEEKTGGGGRTAAAASAAGAGGPNGANGDRSVVNGSSGVNDATNGATSGASNNDEEEALSDVDARVLRSILEEQKLDLQTEDSVKRLLEKGTAPPPPRRRNSDKDKDEDGGKYASTVLKAVSDNAFWNSLRAKTEEILDTAKIFLANRIERDAKLLASVGLFAWDRAKRDVSRALPEGGRTGAAVGRAMRTAVRQLAANSSFSEYVPADNFILPPSKYGENATQSSSVFEELNTVGDEIKFVTESIRDILSGKAASVDGGGAGASVGAAAPKRGLRSVAPAGSSRGAERQRRAYQRRKETVLAREKEGIDKKFGRTVETVADATAEIKREFAVEGNKAGYRSEAAVKAIEGAAAAALLEAGQVGEGWGQLPLGMGQRLFGRAREKEPVRAAAELREAAVVAPVLTMEDLLEERARFGATLRLCLESPDVTWLMPGVVAEKIQDNTFDDQALKDVITTMICARDDVEIDGDAEDEAKKAEMEFDMDGIIAELRKMKGTVDTITSMAAVAAGYDAAERLKGELMGRPGNVDGDGDASLLASLDDIVRDYDAAKLQQEAAAKVAKVAAAKAEAEVASQRVDFSVPGDFSAVAAAAAQQGGQPVNGNAPARAEIVDSNIVDAVVVTDDAVYVAKPFYFAEDDDDGASLVSEDDMDGVLYSSTPVEVVMDDEISDDFFDVKAVTAVPEDDDFEVTEKEEPAAVKILLRTLDVTLFVAEKTFFVGVPVLFRSGKTIASKLDKERRKGLGSEGWEMLENVQTGAKRY